MLLFCFGWSTLAANLTDAVTFSSDSSGAADGTLVWDTRLSSAFCNGFFAPGSPDGTPNGLTGAFINGPTDADAGMVAEAALADAEAAGPGGTSSDPVTTAVAELPIVGPVPGATDDSAPVVPEPGWRADETGVHLAIAADAGLAAVLAGPLDLRLVLHRAPTAPVIALVLGSPAALRAPAPGELAVETLDIAADRDRSVLRALGRSFELTLTVITSEPGEPAGS